MKTFAILFVVLSSLVSTITACLPDTVPLIKNGNQTVPGFVKLYIQERKLGAKRFPLGESDDTEPFGFYRATKLLKPGQKPAQLKLQNRQLFTQFGETLSHRSGNKKINHQLYFSADATKLPQASLASDGCVNGKKVRILVVNTIGSLLYRRFGVKGPVKPGAILERPGPGLTDVDIIIEHF